ncbi:hypothetical protein [Antrihabitans spumae]|uniref:Uncharacterized protein n=1 Tax=Antrihabitans spumae TaxID=3373370 RepID=A0ABW7KNU4_9NOCA
MAIATVKPTAEMVAIRRGRARLLVMCGTTTNGVAIATSWVRSSLSRRPKGETGRIGISRPATDIGEQTTRIAESLQCDTAASCTPSRGRRRASSGSGAHAEHVQHFALTIGDTDHRSDRESQPLVGESRVTLDSIAAYRLGGRRYVLEYVEQPTEIAKLHLVGVHHAPPAVANG